MNKLKKLISMISERLNRVTQGNAAMSRRHVYGHRHVPLSAGMLLLDRQTRMMLRSFRHA